jgi:hypothetical protein
LLGEKSDWKQLYDKLDRLSEFGDEPAEYQDQLRPILSRFVKSFDDPDSDEIKDFWNSIVVAESGGLCGEPPYFLNGWLTGFFQWDMAGRYTRIKKGDPGYDPARHDGARLDGVTYARVPITGLPVGYAQAPFVMDDFRDVERFQAMVLAGTLGKRITDGYPDGYLDAYQRAAKAKAGDGGEEAEVDDDPTHHGTLQPSSGWLLYGPVEHERNVTQVIDLELRSLPDYFRTGNCQ